MNAERSTSEHPDDHACNRSAFRSNVQLFRCSAFTLVELIVSIALVVLLMYGVQRVFTITAKTIAAGQAVSDNTRVARSAQSVFQKDFDSMVTTDAPFMIIDCVSQAAFLNRTDDLSDLHQVQFKATASRGDALTLDIDGDNVEGDATKLGERVPVAATTYRSHRIDILAFFARGLFNRVTGNPGENMVSPMTSSEAFIKYGHMKIWNGTGPPTSAAAFMYPGGGGASVASVGTFTGGFGAATFNPNNFYASQWVVGRTATLLTPTNIDTNGDGIPDAIVDNTGTWSQAIWKRNNVATSLTPLESSTNISVGSSTVSGSPFISEGAVDIADTSIADMRQRFINYLGTNPPNVGNTLIYRMNGNTLMPKPMTSQTLAQTSPIFLRGCTQFIVEFAGDFISQNNDQATATWGDTLAAYMDPNGTDGQIDYVLVGTGTPGNYHKEIRWYGLPRNVHGLVPTIANPNPTAPTIPSNTMTPDAARAMPEVVPFRDVLYTAPLHNTGTPVTGGSFERTLFTEKANYLDVSGTGNGGLGLGDEYRCVFGPNDPKPKMIRITIVLDDPDNRLPTNEGQKFEYVFTLP